MNRGNGETEIGRGGDRAKQPDEDEGVRRRRRMYQGAGRWAQERSVSRVWCLVSGIWKRPGPRRSPSPKENLCTFLQAPGPGPGLGLRPSVTVMLFEKSLTDPLSVDIRIPYFVYFEGFPANETNRLILGPGSRPMVKASHVEDMVRRTFHEASSTALCGRVKVGVYQSLPLMSAFLLPESGCCPVRCSANSSEK